jgi:mono/diheme cytochrome c family protein
MRFGSLAFLLLVSCTKPASQAPVSPEEAAKEALVRQGKTVYSSNCTACHNADPAKDGPLGPAIFGSSKELIEARVLRAEYPAGYTPKRKTKVMVALPQLKGDLDSLAAFLKN